MPDFLLTYHGGKQPDTPEEGQAMKQRWMEWVQSVGDAWVNPGSPCPSWKTVAADGVTDGGGPNPIMGIAILRADSMDAALELVKDSPHLEIGTIGLAEMMSMPG
ncbi:MAG: hypothetical protein QNI99_03465 [Woeseiaceae bacterium]|nr:hypothetical protein [Woeseiaceae bacterium]